MKLIIQRVSRALVTTNNQVIGQIKTGYTVLFGAKVGDTTKQADHLAQKLLTLRVMADQNDKMNLSITDVKGEILVVPQFTLYADTKKGNRPSFVKAAPPKQAEKLFNYFVAQLKKSDLNIQTGQFGTMMNVELVNSGPVTIILKN